MDMNGSNNLNYMMTTKNETTLLLWI